MLYFLQSTLVLSVYIDVIMKFQQNFIGWASRNWSRDDYTDYIDFHTDLKAIVVTRVLLYAKISMDQVFEWNSSYYNEIISVRGVHECKRISNTDFSSKL